MGNKKYLIKTSLLENPWKSYVSSSDGYTDLEDLVGSGTGPYTISDNTSNYFRISGAGFPKCQANVGATYQVSIPQIRVEGLNELAFKGTSPGLGSEPNGSLFYLYDGGSSHENNLNNFIIYSSIGGQWYAGRRSGGSTHMLDGAGSRMPAAFVNYEPRVDHTFEIWLTWDYRIRIKDYRPVDQYNTYSATSYTYNGGFYHNSTDSTPIDTFNDSRWPLSYTLIVGSAGGGGGSTSRGDYVGSGAVGVYRVNLAALMNTGNHLFVTLGGPGSSSSNSGLNTTVYVAPEGNPGGTRVVYASLTAGGSGSAGTASFNSHTENIVTQIGSLNGICGSSTPGTHSITVGNETLEFGWGQGGWNGWSANTQYKTSASHMANGMSEFESQFQPSYPYEQPLFTSVGAAGCAQGGPAFLGIIY